MQNTDKSFQKFFSQFLYIVPYFNSKVVLAIWDLSTQSKK